MHRVHLRSGDDYKLQSSLLGKDRATLFLLTIDLSSTVDHYLVRSFGTGKISSTTICNSTLAVSLTVIGGENEMTSPPD